MLRLIAHFWQFSFIKLPLYAKNSKVVHLKKPTNGKASDRDFQRANKVKRYGETPGLKASCVHNFFLASLDSQDSNSQNGLDLSSICFFPTRKTVLVATLFEKIGPIDMENFDFEDVYIPTLLELSAFRTIRIAIQGTKPTIRKTGGQSKAENFRLHFGEWNERSKEEKIKLEFRKQFPLPRYPKSKRRTKNNPFFNQELVYDTKIFRRNLDKRTPACN